MEPSYPCDLASSLHPLRIPSLLLSFNLEISGCAADYCKNVARYMIGMHCHTFSCYSHQDRTVFSRKHEHIVRVGFRSLADRADVGVYEA